MSDMWYTLEVYSIYSDLEDVLVNVLLLERDITAHGNYYKGQHLFEGDLSFTLVHYYHGGKRGSTQTDVVLER